MLSPRRSAQLGLGAALTLAALSFAALLLRPLTAGQTLAFAEPGAPAPFFKLADPDGRSLSLDDLRGQVSVIYFTSIHCPDCSTYNARIDALARRYRNEQRVRFIAINIDPNVDPVAVRVDAKVVGRTFPTLLDPKSETSNLYSIKSTPQVAVIDPNGTLRYRGPFDDNPAESQVTHRYVADTLASILANPELAFAK